MRQCERGQSRNRDTAATERSTSAIQPRTTRARVLRQSALGVRGWGFPAGCWFGWALLVLLLGSPVPAAQPAPPSGDPVVVDEKTEGVIKGALKWLAAEQQPNGAWGSSGEEKRHPIAMTGYTLMAFQAAGQLPGEGEYGKHVSAGVKFLLDSTGPDGLFSDRNSGQYMYGHGVAAIALAELYGQMRLPTMRSKLEKIIRVILTSQNREGGWRYRPVASDADISVTVLQVVALRAAKNAGLNVPQKTIDNAVKYVKACHHASSGGFAYQPGREPGFARTAAAIYSLQVCGLYEDRMVKAGSEYLLKNQKARQEWFTYGNFYAAPAQYMIGGETWSRWYGKIKEILLGAVSRKGQACHWEPSLDQGRGGVGQVYCTAVYTMILAMPYHYVPLYQR
ncbi:MAG: terpene cyclase/mutase family protein [Verrucomicrobia bacterium]|nr:terpene cyclase/mutase family protein [Verrucomicrobiota bacterium]